MKLVLNRTLGGFPDIFWDNGIFYDDVENIMNSDRTNVQKQSHPIVIKYFIDHPDENIEIVEIPDDSFAVITDYDGAEVVYYSKSPINFK